MKTGKYKLISVAVACLCVIAVLAFSFVSYRDKMNYRFMTKAESDRSDQISASVYKTGAISAEDLTWSLRMLQTPSWTGNVADTEMRHLDIMVDFKRLRTFAPGQKEQLYEATAPFLTRSNKYEPVGAMAVMRAIKDKRAIPSVTALLNDQNDFTRQMAHKTLEALETPAMNA